jgi:hypothetical protein
VGETRLQADAEAAEPLLFDIRFRPKHCPEDVIDFANKRGADRIIYAGYFPMGLSLERIFDEMPRVPIRDKVWSGFRYDNTARIPKVANSAGAEQNHGTS